MTRFIINNVMRFLDQTFSTFMVLRENKALQSGQANTNRLVKQMNVPLYLPEDDTALSCNKTLVQILNTKQSVSNK